MGETERVSCSSHLFWCLMWFPYKNAEQTTVVSINTNMHNHPHSLYEPMIIASSHCSTSTSLCSFASLLLSSLLAYHVLIFFSFFSIVISS